jgi:hypothetical protein
MISSQNYHNGENMYISWKYYYEIKEFQDKIERQKLKMNLVLSENLKQYQLT